MVNLISHLDRNRRKSRAITRPRVRYLDGRKTACSLVQNRLCLRLYSRGTIRRAYPHHGRRFVSVAAVVRGEQNKRSEEDGARK